MGASIPANGDPSFRVATPDDVAALCELIREYYEFDGHPYDRSAVGRAVGEFLRNPSFGRTWLICDGISPVGYICLTLDYSFEYGGRDAFIDELYLRSTHRRRGWGRKALSFVENAAEELQLHALTLHVGGKNSAAFELYRNSGFEHLDRRVMAKRIQPR